MSAYIDQINSSQQIHNQLVNLMRTITDQEKINPNSLKSNTKVRIDIIYHTFLTILGDSFHQNEALVLSGNSLTEKNCPQEYLPFVKSLFLCKKEFKFDSAPKIKQLRKVSKQAQDMPIFHSVFEQLIKHLS